MAENDTRRPSASGQGHSSPSSWSARSAGSSASSTSGTSTASSATAVPKPQPLAASGSFSSVNSSASSIASSTSANSMFSNVSGTSSRTSHSSTSNYYPASHPSVHHVRTPTSTTASSAAKLSTSPTSSGFHGPHGPQRSNTSAHIGVNGTSASSTTSNTQSLPRPAPIPQRSQTLPTSTSTGFPSTASSTGFSSTSTSNDPFERLRREHEQKEAQFRSSHKSSNASLRSAFGQPPTANRSNSMGSTEPGAGFVPTPPAGMSSSPKPGSTFGSGQRSTSSSSTAKPGMSSASGTSSSKKGNIDFDDDLYAKLKEEEERSRARKLNASINSAGSDPGMKTRMAEAYSRYEEKWSTLPTLSTIRFSDIPWPVYTSALTTPSSPYAPQPSYQSGLRAPKPINSIEQLTTTTIAPFILSPHHSEGKSRKDRIKAELLRWHPDRFNGRYLNKVNATIPPGAEESEQDRVKNCVGQVARCLSDMLTMSDAFGE